MKHRELVVGLVQMAAARDPAINVEKAAWKIREIAHRGAQVICLPELFRTTYFPRQYDEAAFCLAEPIPGPTTERFSQLAAELGVVLVVPVFERRAPGLYHNTAVVLDADGSIAGVYRKAHIPDDPLFYEKYYFAPGDTGFRSFATRYGPVGVLICWDQWFPEAARAVALHGASIIFYPSAIGWLASEKATEGERQRLAWQTVHRAQAIMNGLYVAAVNRVGREGEGTESVEFWGSSCVFSPEGELLGEAATDAEDLLVVRCGLDAIERARRGWPFLRDRRVDLYEVLLRRWAE